MWQFQMGSVVIQGWSHGQTSWSMSLTLLQARCSAVFPLWSVRLMSAFTLVSKASERAMIHQLLDSNHGNSDILNTMIILVLFDQEFYKVHLITVIRIV